jgi:hypothetical protein
MNGVRAPRRDAMPAKNKVYSIYPDPRVTAIIGSRVSEIHAALYHSTAVMTAQAWT